jgi:regulatory protein
LAGTLRERGVPDAVAARVLDRFEEVGLIDDRLFARMWVESRQASRGLSARALRSELRTRGVADEWVADALEGIGHDEEVAAARTIALRKVRSVVGLPRSTQVRRISGALARKGYGPAVTSRVVREVLDAPDQGRDLDDGQDAGS